ERVEARAQDRHAETCPVGRILEREEHALPARVAPQLGDLALDPDARQSRQPVGDAAVERGDGVDLAVAVLKSLDLHVEEWYARLQEDFGGCFGRAPGGHELDGTVEVDV